MRKTGGGSIIMMSSLAGLRGAAGLAGYCATKGGVRLFAKAIAMECATFGDGIRVNSVHPGIIDTPIWGKIPTEAAGSGTERADRSGRARQICHAARPRRPRHGYRAGRAVSGLRCVELRDRDGTGHRRRHECGRGGAAGRNDLLVIPERLRSDEAGIRWWLSDSGLALGAPRNDEINSLRVDCYPPCRNRASTFSPP